MMSENDQSEIQSQNNQDKKNMLIQIQDKLYQEISNGSLFIRETPIHLIIDKKPLKSQTNTNINNGQQKLQDKIDGLNSDLQGLYSQLSDKRKKDRQINKQKTRQAISMVNQIKKKKRTRSEYIKYNDSLIRQSEERLNDMIIKHREFKAGQIFQKQKNISSRISENRSRKYERERTQFDNQIEYWSKIQNLQNRKRHKSVGNLLPTIKQARNSEIKKQHHGLQIVSIPRKNTDILLKKRGAEQKVQYQDIVQKFLERAKKLQEKSRIRQQQESRVSKQQGINPQKRSLSNFSKPSYPPQRSKLLGDEYLQQALIAMKKQQSRVKQIEPKALQENNLIVSSEKKAINKSLNIVVLEKKREKLLYNLAHQKIPKQQGNEQLREIQRRLDHMDPQNIQQRLRSKFKVFQKIFKPQNKIQNYYIGRR